MNQPLMIREALLVHTTLHQFKDWLENWTMSHHDQWINVSLTRRSSGGYAIEWYMPVVKPADISRIHFTITHKDPEILSVEVVFADDPEIRAYVLPLLQTIRQRWSGEQDIPDFDQLVSDTQLANVLRLRWVEAQRAYSASAYLATIIMLGSILEGVLLAQIQQSPKVANQASSTPKDRTLKVRPFADWTLDDMLKVAHEMGWIDNDVRAYATVLRGYRNLVHPRAQAAENIFPDADTCHISWPVVKAAIADLLNHKST